MSAPQVTKVEDRLEGYDLARAFAILLMVLVNFQFYLLAPLRGRSEIIPRFLSHLPEGRASTLFVVLAGVGIARMSTRARETHDPDAYRAVRRSLLIRSLVLLVAGYSLRLVWRIDILHFYAAYLLLAATLFLRRGVRTLLAVAVLVTLAAVVLAVLVPVRHGTPHASFSPAGLALDLVIDGFHPILPWFAFLLFGMVLGRLDLRDRARRRIVLSRALAVAVAAETLSIALSAVTPYFPAGVVAHANLFGTGWTPAPLHVVSASATATAMIALAHAIVARAGSHLVVRSLVATGQVSLSAYVFHAAVGIGPFTLLHRKQTLALGAVILWWAAFSVLLVIIAATYRTRFRRGPLEALMRVFAGSPGHGPVPPTAPSNLRAPGAGSWAFAAVCASVLLVSRFTGVAPPALDCPSVELLDGAGRRASQLTLLCPYVDTALVVENARSLSLTTRSAIDAYLEVRRDGDLIAHDDDSGVGLNPRIALRLERGRYAVRVRPYSADTGTFVLVVAEESSQR